MDVEILCSGVIFFMYVADFLILYVLSTIGSCKLHLFVCNTTISQLKIDIWEFDFFFTPYTIRIS